MDIVEFAEKTYGAKLYEWQKEYLRTLDRLYREKGHINVVLHKDHGKMFTYLKLKELMSNGQTDAIK